MGIFKDFENFLFAMLLLVTSMCVLKKKLETNQYIHDLALFTYLSSNYITNEPTFFQKSILSKPNKSVLPPKSMLFSSTNRTRPAGVHGRYYVEPIGQVVSCSWSTITFLLCQSTHSQKIGGFPDLSKSQFYPEMKMHVGTCSKIGQVIVQSKHNTTNFLLLWNSCEI